MVDFLPVPSPVKPCVADWLIAGIFFYRGKNLIPLNASTTKHFLAGWQIIGGITQWYQTNQMQLLQSNLHIVQNTNAVRARQNRFSFLYPRCFHRYHVSYRTK